MTTDPEAALSLAGFVVAGKVSDFMPLTPPLSQTAEAPSHEDHANSKGDMASTTACPAVVGGDCSVKGEGKGAHLIKVIEIPQPAGRYPPTKRVAVSYFHSKWYAFLNICPHQGSALSRGSMTDIEDMGIVWGAGVTCSLHGWTFDALSGQSDSTRFVVDTFDVKELDGVVYVSEKPRNTHVAGPRRDFGGRELN
ncbi:hypothetical protein BG005_002146 [Podila minutissima]|nr:hypothetical protein BG005_002146 [Podila minutissima]